MLYLSNLIYFLNLISKWLRKHNKRNYVPSKTGTMIKESQNWKSIDGYCWKRISESSSDTEFFTT